ncbi:MAG: PQQ-dependent sugar dehydrogenase, partial [Gloeobacteraceae cyanobacterium ES-bin-316]|nr:PQQ-dependent sugar dehydrogenase [Ferruginibacter sp.]
MKKLVPQLIASCFLCLIYCLPLHLNAQPVIGFQSVTAGLSNPVDVVSAPGESRLFIAQQNGLIRIWNGTTLSDFINIGSVLTPFAGGEQGLLSVAFHPSYNTNRYFFVWYTNNTGAVTLARYRRNISNPDIADVASAQVLLSIAKPGTPYFENHNGGKLNFGTDGMLYISIGDGGSGGDPFNNAQNGNSLLGKMLRLDVNSFATSAPFYDIPADNPFLAVGDGIRDEIYATGLRNPWRWSFDRANGDMWIGDVGQGEWEEVNWLPAGSASGANYGWKCYEGNHVYAGGCGTPPADSITPVFEYGHNGATGGFSITGGYVYRGPDPANSSLLGYYLTVDYVTNNLWLIRPNGLGGFATTQQSGVLNNISSFGEGSDGTLYALRRSNGTLYRVIVTSVLPVTLTRFSASGFNGYNQLSWTSSSEFNAKKYHVEFSSNGQQFNRVGEVEARGTSSASNYSFRHNIQSSQIIYYRLAIEDNDGSVRYSEIIRLADAGIGVKIYPTFVT